MDKKNLLTIGEMSKLSGASIHSLRYYERIKVLTPAYTDPDTGYRYYSFDQTYLLEFIGFCIEMSIPLKDMKRFTQSGDVLDAHAFLNEGKSIAIKKLGAIKQGLRFIKDIERQIDIVEKYKPGEIYTRHIPQKLFYVNKCVVALEEITPIDLALGFVNMSYDGDNYTELPEYGMMAMHSSHGAEYYAFGQVPDTAESTENIRIIPAGEYFCVLNQSHKLSEAPEIFREILGDCTDYIAIEADMFAAKYKISEPMHELRVLITPI